MIVDMRLINVTRIEWVITISTTEQAIYTDGRSVRHVQHSAACETLCKATAIDIADSSSEEVDDS